MSQSTDDRSDDEIVVAVLAGDVNQFEELVRRYDKDLMSTATWRLGRGPAAEEAVHESFIAAYRGLETFDSGRSFRNWLLAILVNQCHRSLRYRRKSQFESLDGPHEEALTTDNPEGINAVIEQEESELLHHHLARLAPQLADAIWLRFFGKQKYREIAEATGVSLATAKNRVREGLLRLSQLLTRQSRE